jgi:NADPH:quinone reductase-like Zn-dependent oxidoreductase
MSERVIREWNGLEIMKAIIWTKYGSSKGLQLGEVEKPIPKDNEVLIKIHTTTVTAGDIEMRDLKLPLGFGYLMRLYNGVRRPKRITILGQELAGEIEEVGKDVTMFKVGDKVFGAPDFYMGTYAEYRCLPEDAAIVLKPEGMSFVEAVTFPLGGINALHFLRFANIQPGQKVLINGAGGSIGTVGVQLAKHYGAEVTAVDSDKKTDMLRSIGADHVLDYTKENFTKRGETYDVIFDVVGKAPFSGSMRSLTENGIFLVGNYRIGKLLRGRWASRRGSKRVIDKTADPNPADLNHLKELFLAGAIKPVIDRSFSLEQIVEAHEYVEAGGKIGNVVINVV